jgi:uncharacterized protein (TIGR00251 family)
MRLQKGPRMRLAIKVVPKASRDRVVGWLGDRLKVQVRAAPERGKANAAVAALLSDFLGAPVRVVAGESSALKTVEIDAAEDVVRKRLPAPLAPGSRL